MPDPASPPAPSNPAAAPGIPAPAAAWRPPAGSPADPRFWQPVDEAFDRLLQQEQSRDPSPWLLLQTIASSVTRRALYSALGARPGWRVLDAGTGFGPVAVELAGAYGCRVVGADADHAQLTRTGSAVAALSSADWLRPSGQAGPASVSLATALVGPLPFPAGAFDAVLARFLLQHVEDPQASVADLARVTKPGGLVCVIDVDDGLSVSYPAPPGPVHRLEEAYRQAQRERGGDRAIGRKVAGMLDAAGVSVAHVLVLPQATYGTMTPSSWGQRLLHHRLSTFADELVARGLVDRETAAEGLRMLATEELPAATTVDMHLAVIGRRRP